MAILEFRDDEREDLTCRSCRMGDNRGSREDGQGWAWWWCEDVNINSFLYRFASAYRASLLALHFRYWAAYLASVGGCGRVCAG